VLDTIQSERKFPVSRLADARSYLEKIGTGFLSSANAASMRRTAAATEAIQAAFLQSMGEEILANARQGRVQEARDAIGLYALHAALSVADRPKLATRAQPDRTRLLQQVVFIWVDFLRLDASAITKPVIISSSQTSSKAGGACVDFIMAATNPVVAMKNQSSVTPDIARHAIRAFQKWYPQHLSDQRMFENAVSDDEIWDDNYPD
jgi:hypothetical protein